MTFKIDRESLPMSPEAFDEAVAQHIAAMTEYEAHMAKVRADEANPDLADDERHVAFPPPATTSLVAQAIRRNGDRIIADYELVGPSLQVRKERLSMQVTHAEQEAIAIVMPPMKQRYWQMREMDIRKADQERFAEYLRRLPNDGARSSVVEGAERYNYDMRPAHETQMLSECADRAAKADAIGRWAAKQHFDIDDLTDETIGAWEMTPFNG